MRSDCETVSIYLAESQNQAHDLKMKRTIPKAGAQLVFSKEDKNHCQARICSWYHPNDEMNIASLWKLKWCQPWMRSQNATL